MLKSCNTCPYLKILGAMRGVYNMQWLDQSDLSNTIEK
jgi:hypothetical protein